MRACATGAAEKQDWRARTAGVLREGGGWLVLAAFLGALCLLILYALLAALAFLALLVLAACLARLWLPEESRAVRALLCDMLRQPDRKDGADAGKSGNGSGEGEKGDGRFS